MLVCPRCGHENGETAKFCEECATPLAKAAPARELRKVVTVLFCDVVGSTALGESTDPEALRALLARYFERMKAIVERHGGSVEKFIGDAVMAVFGVPQVHEDDALRACRAAVEMREALPELAVQARIGVNTGEVVAGTEERLATGDAVNVAARLEQAALPGVILIGEDTLRLVSAGVEVGSVELLELRGKTAPVRAYPLVSLLDAPERSHTGRFVGRQAEIGLLGEAWQRALVEKRCELVTVLGEAGVGKSRLIAELVASLDVRTVHGRCVPYGEGITYWPVVEVLKQLDALPSDPAAAESIRSLLRESDQPTSAEEIAWAFRKLLEEQAPLVVLFDDVQWGEETLLDLIEGVALLSSAAPLLILCAARPELWERRPAWPISVRLGPLPEQAVEELIGDQVTAALRGRIAAASGGNPLFVTEMVAMAETADGEVSVPPTLRALLTARLDQLDPAERRVLECGAIEGEVFHRGGVQALASEEQQVTPRLAALVRRELIRPDRAVFAGEDGFRFRHLLIRDAAYDALPKAVRAELHERFAIWLDEEHAQELVELDELLGYHLEQAVGYLTELGSADAHTRLLAARASEHFSSAGHRAHTRGDLGATLTLLGRAAALLSVEEPSRPRLLAELAIALAHSDDLERAESVATDAVEAAEQTGDPQTRARALLAYLEVRWRGQGMLMTAEMEEEIAQAIRVFEQAGDEGGLARAWHLMARVHLGRVEITAAIEALRRALTHARNAGDLQQEGWLRIVLGRNLLFGSPPLDEVGQYNRENRDWARANHNPRVEASVLVDEGERQAMLGNFAEGRALLARGRALFEELGVKMALSGCFFWSAEVEELAGNLVAAEAEMRAGLKFSDETGNKHQAVECAFEIARLADLQGRYEDAESLPPAFDESVATDDRWRQVAKGRWRARVMARRGEMEEAVRLTREVVALAPSGEAPNERGACLLDAAAVFVLAGRHEEAAPILEEALALYERKGNLVMAERTRARLAELRADEAS